MIIEYHLASAIFLDRVNWAFESELDQAIFRNVASSFLRFRCDKRPKVLSFVGYLAAHCGIKEARFEKNSEQQQITGGNRV